MIKKFKFYSNTNLYYISKYALNTIFTISPGGAIPPWWKYSNLRDTQQYM